MSNMIFIPLSDELIYDHPERISGPVIPFVQDARRVSGDALFCDRLAHTARTHDKDKPSAGRSKPDSRLA